MNDRLIEYCLSHGTELTRSRPKNDQAWIEQKNGAIVRKLLGYQCFEGLTAARAITRLYGASRLFVNFFQPSFKLASKQRDGAKVTKHYHPPSDCCNPTAFRWPPRARQPVTKLREATRRAILLDRR